MEYKYLLSNQNNNIFHMNILTQAVEATSCVARQEHTQAAIINIFDKEARHLETVNIVEQLIWNLICFIILMMF